MSIIEKLEKKLKKDPSSISFIQLAEEYRKMGKIKEAIDLCERGLSYHPNYWSAYILLGKCYYDIDELESAKENLENAISGLPDNIQAIALLAEIYEKLNLIDKALEKYKLLQLLAPKKDIEDKIAYLEGKYLEEEQTLQINLSVVKRAISEGEQEKENFIEGGLKKEIEHQDNTIKLEAIKEGNKPKESQEEELAELIDTNVYKGSEEVLEKSQAEPTEILSLINPEVLSPKEEGREDLIESEKAVQEITTETLGEIYASQGYLDKAIKIYQKLLLAEPNNETAINRLKELIIEFNSANAKSNRQFFKEEKISEEEARKDLSKSLERKKRISVLENWLQMIKKESSLKGE